MAPAALPLRIVLLGPPASGKGTQGRRLAESLSLAYLSTGALLRENVENHTPLGQLAKPLLDRGEYLPDALMCPILADWLSRQTGGWVLDGFPRSLPQAVFLDDWLGENGLKLNAAVSLEVPFDQLLARIADRVECTECRWTGNRAKSSAGNHCPLCESPAGPRSDDSEDNFRSRHSEFVSLTQLAIDHYRKVNILRICAATAPQDEGAASILAQLSHPARSPEIQSSAP